MPSIDALVHGITAMMSSEDADAILYRRTPRCS
jgi:hypothetical protein